VANPSTEVKALRTFEFRSIRAKATYTARSTANQKEHHSYPLSVSTFTFSMTAGLPDAMALISA
jgi:hypothetical protein